jgi:hypothetical protein
LDKGGDRDEEGKQNGVIPLDRTGLNSFYGIGQDEARERKK